MRPGRRGGFFRTACLAVALSSCRPAASPAPPRAPEDAALLLLRLSHDSHPDEIWARVVDAERTRDDPARFAAVLSGLRRIDGGAKVVRVERLGADRSVVDLECALAGGGKGFLAVQAALLPDGSWRVVSIDGPGIEWPAPRATQGEGLTTSSHP